MNAAAGPSLPSGAGFFNELLWFDKLDLECAGVFLVNTCFFPPWRLIVTCTFPFGAFSAVF